jgi:hypothetical protein
LKESLRDQIAENEVLDVKVDALEREVAALKGVVKSRESVIESVKAERDDFKRRHDLARDQGANDSSGISSSTTSSASGSTTSTATNPEVNKLHDDVTRLQLHVDRLCNENSSLKSRLIIAVNSKNDFERRLAVEEKKRFDSDASNGNDSSNYYNHNSSSSSSSSSNNNDNQIDSNSKGLRKRRDNVPSIVESLYLNESGVSATPVTKKLAGVITNVDTWSVEFGYVLKQFPLARLGFLCYLIVLHFYMFTVLAYNVHNFEAEHGDFGSYRHLDQLHGQHNPGYIKRNGEGSGK